MAKADFNRDYYADLELAASADVADIKRQFRKLALKYHPDRNPGKESEVNAKFQTIQAAHEILTSPDQKAKYDAHRSRKANRYPTASGVRGNPWQDVADQYPTPPRRPGQAPTSASRGSSFASAQHKSTSSSTSASSSAHASEFASGTSSHRYSGFNPPPTAKTGRDRYEKTYQAWQNMRPVPNPPRQPKHPQSASAAYASKSTGAPTSNAGPGTSSSMPPPPPPRTAAQKHKADASFGTRKSTGFFPRSPVGDEPPAANTSNYFFTNRTHSASSDESNAPGETTDYAPPTEDACASTEDESRTKLDGSFLETRQSTPYQTRGGERLNPFEGGSPVGISRTKSYRAARDQDKAEPRRRSSSLPDESETTANATGKDATSNQGQGAAYVGSTAGRAYAVPGTSRTRPRPRAGTGTPYVTPSTPMPQFDEQYQKMQENDLSTTPNANPTYRHDKTAFAANDAFESEKNGKSEWNAKNDPIFSNLSISDNTSGHPSPGTPKSTDSQSRRFMSTSAEDINTRFVAEEHAGSAWQFSAGNQNQESVGSSSYKAYRSQSGSRLGRRSPAKDYTISGPRAAPSTSQLPSQPQPPPPPPPPPQPLFSSNTPLDGQTTHIGATGGFDAKKWAEKIGLEHFELPLAAPPRKATPTQLTSRPIKKIKQAQRPPTTTFVVEDSGDSATERTEEAGQQAQKPVSLDTGTNADAGLASPVAMDIDTPEQADYTRTGGEGQLDKQDAAKTIPNEPRNIPVEPSRPEWRAGDAKSTSGVESVLRDTAAPGNSSEGSGSGSVNNNTRCNHVGGSEDSPEFLASMADLKKVEPFAESRPGGAGSGLGSLGELRTNLPFESRASVPTHPPKPPRKKTIAFPSPPTAPHPPAALAVPGLQPSTGAWKKYAAEFQQYMREWLKLDAQFVDHFQARRNALEKQEVDMHICGLQTPGDDVVLEYLDWMSQDAEVRERWSTYCTQHEQTVRQFKAFRDRMR